jgi:hypothetical protein
MACRRALHEKNGLKSHASATLRTFYTGLNSNKKSPQSNASPRNPTSKGHATCFRVGFRSPGRSQYPVRRRVPRYNAGGSGKMKKSPRGVMSWKSPTSICVSRRPRARQDHPIPVYFSSGKATRKGVGSRVRLNLVAGDCLPAEAGGGVDRILSRSNDTNLTRSHYLHDHRRSRPDCRGSYWLGGEHRLRILSRPGAGTKDISGDGVLMLLVHSVLQCSSYT